MKKIGGIRFIGTSKNKAGVIAFMVEGIHPQDLGTILDKQGVAIRTATTVVNRCTGATMSRQQQEQASRSTTHSKM